MSEENITINKFNSIKNEKVIFLYITVIMSQNMVPDTYQCLSNNILSNILNTSLHMVFKSISTKKSHNSIE